MASPGRLETTILTSWKKITPSNEKENETPPLTMQPYFR
jgi:hypothetical protein